MTSATQVWRSLVLFLLGLYGAAIVTFFWFVYSWGGKITAYGDSTAKINNALRVFDNPSGHFSLPQIGSVWLPAHTFLTTLFVKNEAMYRSGLAGSVWSMVFYVVGAIALYQLTVAVTQNRFAGLASVAVMFLNINLIYFAVTPMTEMLVMTSTILCCYCLVLFEQQPTWKRAGLAGGVLAFSCLVRYEFWYFLVFAAPLVWMVLRREKRSTEGRLGIAMVIFFPAVIVILAWLVLWELQIMGHPLYFAVSQYSAKAIDVDPYQPAFVHNLPVTFGEYLGAVRWNIQDAILGLAVLGILIYLYRLVRHEERLVMPLYLVGTPAFFLFSLFMGQNAIDMRYDGSQLPYNLRYGLTILSLIAVGVGYLVARILSPQPQGLRELLRWPSRVLAVGIVVAVIGLQVVPWQVPLQAPILQDRAAQANPERKELAEWLGANYRGGNILMEAFGQNTPLQFESGVWLGEFVSEGGNPYWTLALEDPADQVAYVVARKGDLLDRTVTQTEDFQHDFKVGFENAYGRVYVQKT